MIRNEVSMVQSMMWTFALEMVEVDEIIKDLSPSASVFTGKSLTLTAALRDKMLAVVPQGLDTASIRNILNQHLGETASIPDFYYKTAIGDYNAQFSFADTSSGNMIIFWSTDKTKIKIAFSGLAFVNDSTAKTTRVYYVSSSGTSSPSGTSSSSDKMIMTMKEAGDASHGINISQVCSSSGTYNYRAV